MSSKLLKFLASPEKVTSTFNWRKSGSTILALDIGRERIGLAVASHPSVVGEPIAQELEPLPMKLETLRECNRRTLALEVVDGLQSVVREHNVCGFIVTWPVQEEGRCGAPCGRVLHTLESLVNHSSSIITANRLFCLWDVNHVTSMEDDRGRCPIYGRSSTKTLHVASLQQYNYESSSTTAADIWNDFCKVHWPELYEKQNEEEDLVAFY